MKTQIFTLLILFTIGTFAEAEQKLHRSPWGGGYNQEDIEDPYYFIHPIQKRAAIFVGGCGKGSQDLNSKTAYLRIQHPILKRAIKAKLNLNEEFTAMYFLMNGEKQYLNILDEDFIDAYCRVSGNQTIPVSLDGFQVDTQYEKKYLQKFVIEKVYLNE